MNNQSLNQLYTLPKCMNHQKDIYRNYSIPYLNRNGIWRRQWTWFSLLQAVFNSLHRDLCLSHRDCIIWSQFICDAFLRVQEFVTISSAEQQQQSYLQIQVFLPIKWSCSRYRLTRVLSVTTATAKTTVYSMSQLCYECDYQITYHIICKVNSKFFTYSLSLFTSEANILHEPYTTVTMWKYSVCLQTKSKYVYIFWSGNFQPWNRYGIGERNLSHAR